MHLSITRIKVYIICNAVVIYKIGENFFDASSVRARRSNLIYSRPCPRLFIVQQLYLMRQSSNGQNIGLLFIFFLVAINLQNLPYRIQFHKLLQQIKYFGTAATIAKEEREIGIMICSICVCASDKCFLLYGSRLRRSPFLPLPYLNCSI